MHGGTNAGAPVGNENALKHGHFSGAALAERRRLGRLLKQFQGLVDDL
jgi:glucans biosynthesis protein